MSSLVVIGTMSGSSLDGLDLAACRFRNTPNGTDFAILNAKTVPFSDKWFTRLSNLSFQDALTFSKTHSYFGRYMAHEIVNFMEQTNLKGKVNLIASHGHTIFHEPKHKLSVQIGCGASLSELTQLPVVCNFRNNDTALGGEGAPMVPMAEKDLFPQYSAFLNLGGIANCSIIKSEKHSQPIAFDICYLNQVFNFLAHLKDQEFDQDGNLAKSGKVEDNLLESLQDDYYKLAAPKSLSNQGLSQRLKRYMVQDWSPENKMRTAVQHKSEVINKSFQLAGLVRGEKVLVTGGGAFNKFFMSQLQSKSNFEFVKASEQLIQFKEALCIAYAGYLRYSKKPNFLKSVTGASANSSGGALYLPSKNLAE